MYAGIKRPLKSIVERLGRGPKNGKYWNILAFLTRKWAFFGTFLLYAISRQNSEKFFAPFFM